MNNPNPNPNPILPLGPLSTPPKGKSNVRIAVIAIIALHAVFFGGLLLQGCKPKTTEGALGRNDPYGMTPTNEVAPYTPPAGPTFDTNLGAYTVTTPSTPLYPAATTPQGVAVTEPGGAPVVSGMDAGLTPSLGTREYVVKLRDTPAQIAKQHGVTLNAFMNANPGLEPRKLKVGQKVQIPAAAEAARTAAGDAGAAAPAVGGESVVTHVVKNGENLTRIARKYGVTVPEVRAANNLKSDRITVGQKLKIPGAKTAPAASAPAEGFGGGTATGPATLPAGQ